MPLKKLNIKYHLAIYKKGIYEVQGLAKTVMALLCIGRVDTNLRQHTRIKGKGNCVNRLGLTSIGLSLYIYRPGKTYPFTSRIIWGLFTKTLILLGLYKPDRSDRSARPIRPVDLSRCQIWLSTYAPLLFGEFHKPKSKNYPDVHVLNRAYNSKNKN